MGLEQYREQIDRVDKELTALFEERMGIVEQVAAYKLANGLPVFDPAREQQKLTALKAQAPDAFTGQGLQELFSQLMTISRKKQYRQMEESGAPFGVAFAEIPALPKEGVRVVYQGAEGSYSELALIRAFGEGAQRTAVETFRDAMGMIEEGSADFAVLPIENSTAGVVSETYDLLAAFENYIVGEVVLPIHHCLLAPEGASLESIKSVYAHPQALLQSARFLNAHPAWAQIGMKNNAFAARKVAEENSITQAAVAGEHAASRYGLKVLARHINQAEKNSTRFVLVTNRREYVHGSDKVSLCLELSHESGALYRALSHIMYNGLNMTKIESRPIEERNWEYRFFIDFEGNLGDSAVRSALRGLREECKSLRVLGNYPTHEGEEK